mmetsp:Transcript_29263/g.33539  ORF Transcript_29263/g.33539 Transcript_29263/m.33539 type:complete len:85 (-) Transcript_29263:37-291(-)
MKHEWFASIEFKSLYYKEIDPEYIPEIPEFEEDESIQNSLVSYSNLSKTVKSSSKKKTMLMESYISDSRMELIKNSPYVNRLLS